MSCHQCKCNLCARSVELSPQYFTPGEVDAVCWSCDECSGYDPKKRSQYRRECPSYLKPEKLGKLREVAANHYAQAARAKFTVIVGGKR